MKRRTAWAVLAGAAGATLVLAVAFATVIDHAMAASAPPPRLHTVPASALAAMHLRMGPASAPPYCEAQQAVAQRGWLPAGSVGCPISRSDAESVASSAPRGQALESVLAAVSTGPPPSLRDQVAWVVVVRLSMVRLPCNPSTVGGTVIAECYAVRMGPANIIAVVDAHSPQLLAAFRIGAGGAGLPPMRELAGSAG